MWSDTENKPRNKSRKKRAKVIAPPEELLEELSEVKVKVRRPPSSKSSTLRIN